ncbi:DDE-type integrase/transposase/recombinase [Rhodococcus sp. IEGM 1366]
MQQSTTRSNTARKYLWRAVDKSGNILDVLVQSRRNAKRRNASFAS